MMKREEIDSLTRKLIKSYGDQQYATPKHSFMLLAEDLSTLEQQILATEFMLVRYYYPNVVDCCIYCFAFNQSAFEPSCQDCPWRIFYDDISYACEEWFENMCPIVGNSISYLWEEGLDDPLVKERIAMLQRWHTSLLNELERRQR